MKGLVLKDFYSLRSILRIYLLLFVLLLAISFFAPSFGPFIVSFLVLMISMQQLTNFSFDDASKWNCYAKSLPLRSSTIVGARYLASLLLLCGAVVITFSAGLLATLLQGGGTEEILALATVCTTAVCLFLAISAVAFPACYKFGAEKGRYVMAGSFLAVFAIVMIFLQSFSLDSITSAVILTIGVIILCTCIALYCVSFFLSVRIYQNKEY